jgi:hypothetical protein
VRAQNGCESQRAAIQFRIGKNGIAEPDGDQIGMPAGLPDEPAIGVESSFKFIFSGTRITSGGML